MSEKCDLCKKDFDEKYLLDLSGKRVCANCKPEFIQGLKENVYLDVEQIGSSVSSESLYEIIDRHRQLMIVLYLEIIFIIIFFVVFFIFLITGLYQNDQPLGIFYLSFTFMWIILRIFQIVCIKQVCNEIKLNSNIYITFLLGLTAASFIYQLFIFAPLILLLLLSFRCSQILKNAGFKIGFFGVYIKA
jgi:hypothetical protein